MTDLAPIPPTDLSSDIAPVDGRSPAAPDVVAPGVEAPDAAAPDGAGPPLRPRQARRIPNTTMTEADWAEAMRLFCEAGWSDARIAVKFNLALSSVTAHRFSHGIARADYPVIRARGVTTPVRAVRRQGGEGEAGSGAEPDGPSLNLPEHDEPRAVASALKAHGLALMRDGRMKEAEDYFRLARSVVRTAHVESSLVAPWSGPDAVAGAQAAPAPPELREAQRPPAAAADGRDWKTWLFLGGRGAGKTLAGAAWLAGQAKSVERLALVGPTYADVREVMIEGPSGLRGRAAAFGPAHADGSIERPRYEASRRRLIWPNGATAQVFTAEEPDGLRGPQFAAAWCDEVCAWSRPSETLAQLRMGLRLGADPRLVLTTTPRPGALLRGLLAEPGLAVTRGSALDNAEHLAPGFVQNLRDLYGGTRLERQEVDGEVLEALEGAVFRRVDIERARVMGAEGPPARFERLVVAVDPPAGMNGSACGIVIAGVASSTYVGPRLWVLADRTVRGLTVGGWSSRVAEAAKWAAGLGFTLVVAEANQGGEMVRSVLKQAAEHAPIRLVHAKVGKRERAEPVSLLYEQGRVCHAPGLAALEDQMLLLGGEERAERGVEAREGHSPDRADALVWALTALVIEPPNAEPRIRQL
jgi:phage terminase large subunit-like protein